MIYGIAFGSNVGDRLGSLRMAASELRRLAGAEVQRASHVYETAPVDCPADSGAYLNAVAEVQTELEPRALHAVLQRIEADQGRPAVRERNAPRPLDLDILYASGCMINEPQLIIPHPRLALRRFVLQPLHDLDPDLLPHGCGQTVSLMLAQLTDDPSDVRRVSDDSWARC
jgi:2-amino-4-hydroxy-6-hydroxymethyldihydropteridine diphosphokinase